MKKIMFSDRFGLTHAVIFKVKTMTRRVVKDVCGSLVTQVSGLYNIEVGRDGFTVTYSTGVRQHVFPAYRVGEEVAVAQCYEDAILDVGEEEWNKRHKWYCIENLRKRAGLHNKMFVQADLMPHRIRITDLKLERLQDISEEDCMREGIARVIIDTKVLFRPAICFTFYGDTKPMPTYKTPKQAFAALIDKINGKGTWEKNPWVFVYEFKLVK